MMREIAKRMQARADELAARVKKGETLEAVAASARRRRHPGPGPQPPERAQMQGMSQDILGKTFTSKQGDVFTAENNRFGFVVGKLESVHAGEGPTLARMAEDMRPQMSVAIYRELAETARFAARQKVKVTIDAARARAALGLSRSIPRPPPRGPSPRRPSDDRARLSGLRDHLRGRGAPAGLDAPDRRPRDARLGLSEDRPRAALRLPVRVRRGWRLPRAVFDHHPRPRPCLALPGRSGRGRRGTRHRGRAFHAAAPAAPSTACATWSPPRGSNGRRACRRRPPASSERWATT